MNNIIRTIVALVFIGGCSQQTSGLASYSEQIAGQIASDIEQALTQLSAQTSADINISHEDQQFIDHIKAKLDAGRGVSNNQKNRFIEIMEKQDQKFNATMDKTEKAVKSLLKLASFMEVYLEYCEHLDHEAQDLVFTLYDALTQGSREEHQNIYWESHRDYERGFSKADWGSECSESNMNNVLDIFKHGAKNLSKVAL